MLEFNGQKFAETEREVVDSLFTFGGTVAGKAKRNKTCIKLYELNGEIAGVVSHGGVIGTATRQDDGKVWYSYGWPVIAGPEPKLSEQQAIVDSLSVRRAWKRNELVYYYK